MARHSANGSSAAAFETTPFPTSYAAQEWEDETMESWELPEYSGEFSPESWETPEIQGMQEYQELQEFSPYASPYAAGEWEDEMTESWESGSLGEYGEYGENLYAGAMSAEDESWEMPEAGYYASTYASGETEDEDEAFRYLARMAPRVLPAISRVAQPMIRRIIPYAQRAVPRVVQSVLGGPPPARYGAGVAGSPGGYGGYPAARGRGIGGARATTARALVRQLSAVLGEADREASALEAQLFGANEAQGEIAGHEVAHEAALTEVLAAEAAHTTSESEAAALLGTALPITIRITGGRRLTRGMMPVLVTSNARLVRGIYRSGPAGPQLLRTVPAIQRRTILGLRSLQRSGQPITPPVVRRVMAANAAKVLGSPRLTGQTLVRNSAIRQGTVAPARPLPGRRYP